MTRRYTGAEARVLLEAARVQYIEPGRTVILPGTNAANARLLLAAPDLAESVSAVEAERDEAQGAYLSLEANCNAQHTTLLALEAERDALRAAIRSALAAYDKVYCDDGYHLDREAALAALREAAK